MGRSATGDGVRQRDDLLAEAARLAESRSMGATASCDSAAFARCQDHRLVEGLYRCIDRTGKKGGEATGPNPVDRGRPGSKHHIITDLNGIPLAVALTAANVHDSNMLEPMLDLIPVLRNKRGRPTHRPQKLHGDKGYDYPKCRMACTQRRIKHRIARRGIESSSHLGKHRWVVERTFAWLHRFRRLLVRFERLALIHLAFLTLAAALVAFRFC